MNKAEREVMEVYSKYSRRKMEDCLESDKGRHAGYDQ